jgi:hypothetical protein
VPVFPEEIRISRRLSVRGRRGGVIAHSQLELTSVSQAVPQSMSLNMFHFAGVGSKNVTLGVQRLREIVLSSDVGENYKMGRKICLASLFYGSRLAFEI